ncbi:MAG: hypothetical protein M3Y41_02345 [Pseudomonadota bacterium]|nr:hypothetical protein [Pseudomonadota bacterium]
MLNLSFAILAANVLLGLALIGLHAARRATGALRILGPSHGALGMAGFVALVVALTLGPARGVASGAGSFGLMAAVILGLVLPAGLWVMARVRRRSDATIAIGVHAALAVFAVVMLAAYVSAPS